METYELNGIDGLLHDLAIAKNGASDLPVELKGVCGAYVLYLENADIYYIGSSLDIRERFANHRNTLSRNCHRNRLLQREYNKNKNVIVKIVFIRTISHGEAIRYENNLLQKYNRSDMVANLWFTAGAGPGTRVNFPGMAGRKHSEQTKALLALRTKEQFSNPEARKRHSDGTKEKLKDPEYVKKLLLAQQEGRERYLATVDISKIRREQWDKPGVKERHLESMKDRFISVSVNGTVYPSINEAARAIGMSNVGLIYRLDSPKHISYFYTDQPPEPLEEEFQKRLDHILSLSLESAGNNKVALTRSGHSFPGVYLLHFEGADKFYISSASNLFERLRILLTEIRNTKTSKPRKPKLTEALGSTENKRLSVSWLRCDDARQRAIIEVQLIDKHKASGKLLND